MAREDRYSLHHRVDYCRDHYREMKLNRDEIRLLFVLSLAVHSFSKGYSSEAEVTQRALELFGLNRPTA